ncbi:MAG: hypothetical protein V4805_18045 [Pseudomonadota bacterium]
MPSKQKDADTSGSRQSTRTRGGTSEQHAEAGRQSHKNDAQKSQSGAGKKKSESGNRSGGGGSGSGSGM